MKKGLLSITLMAFTTSIFGQSFNIGIKGGINSQKITTETSYIGRGINYSLFDLKSDAENGFNLGAFARFGGKRLYLQPELLYSVKKGNNTFVYIPNDGEVHPFPFENPYYQSFDVKSIQVPLLLGYEIIDLKLASLRIFTGPAMSIILKDSNIGIKNLGAVMFDPSLYDPKNYNSNVWDWQAGGGVDFGIFVFDVRYEWGLNNISDGEPEKVSFINKGNTLTFSLGIKFL